MNRLVEKIDKNKLPKHIAIIMDGNGRWAEERNEDRLYGHYHGVESVRAIVEICAELEISYLTLYAFSTENWDRPAKEIEGLMSLLVDTLHKEVDILNKNNVQLNAIGNIAQLPVSAQKVLDQAIEKTKSNTGLKLIMALSYSSRWEIENAVKKIAQKVLDRAISIEQIDAKIIQQNLCTNAIPDPELMIRTSGEFRISNFLLYQLAYTELYFTTVLWPDFKQKDLLEAIIDYQHRERRFGKISTQLKND